MHKQYKMMMSLPLLESLLAELLLTREGPSIKANKDNLHFSSKLVKPPQFVKAEELVESLT